MAQGKIVCGCYKVTEEEVIKAIKNGADTVEKIGKVTKAGTGCGNCKGGLQQILDSNKPQDKNFLDKIKSLFKK
ncbi:(2Fe-2S)-binding protein [Terrisporobacter vanillatitrophus]|uniref:(2Fe-2S)-binding protein n=1 Tax=Terrisporobacter vanillatitrophus TaxID=3058402 RepID=UPI0033694417